jgi:hypothetical protein
MKTLPPDVDIGPTPSTPVRIVPGVKLRVTVRLITDQPLNRPLLLCLPIRITAGHCLDRLELPGVGVSN